MQNINNFNKIRDHKLFILLLKSIFVILELYKQFNVADVCHEQLTKSCTFFGFLASSAYLNSFQQ